MFIFTTRPFLANNTKRSLLVRFQSTSSSKIVPLWIGGAPRTAPSSFKVHHPISGEHVSNVSAADSDILNEAISSSAEAFKLWSREPANTRRTILSKALSLLADRQDLLSSLITTETPVEPLILNIDQYISTSLLTNASDLCTSVHQGVIPQTVTGELALVMREPYGVVFSLSPWNMPRTLHMRAVVYPLMCGNTVVLKGSEKTARLALALGQLFSDAGLPPNVLQIVQFKAEDTPRLVQQAINHRDVRMVNFTGSVPVGRKIGAMAGEAVKPCLLELGGKASVCILEDADVEVAANNAIHGAYLHSGQICMSSERVVVHEAVYDQFVSAVKKIIDGDLAKLGNFEMASSSGVDKVSSMVDEAVQQGATLLTAPRPSSSHPSSFQPVILTNVTPSMRIFDEETFSPCLIIIKASSTDEIVDIVNNSEFGLTASVWSKDIMKAVEVARRIESGAVHINSSTIHDEPTLPHGAYKSSGFGRFNGQWAIDSFTQTKTITIKNQGVKAPLSILRGNLS